MNRNVQQLFVWDEVRKIKNNEKKKVLEMCDEMLREKKSFVNYHSKEILEHKKLRSLSQEEEVRFD